MGKMFRMPSKFKGFFSIVDSHGSDTKGAFLAACKKQCGFFASIISYGVYRHVHGMCSLSLESSWDIVKKSSPGIAKTMPPAQDD
jgi:hypothetical protein